MQVNLQLRKPCSSSWILHRKRGRGRSSVSVSKQTSLSSYVFFQFSISLRIFFLSFSIVVFHYLLLLNRIRGEEEEEIGWFSVGSVLKTRRKKEEMDVPSSWDALRKQARKLEAQLDEQMNLYRKVVSSKGSTKVDVVENENESEIDRLLKQLQQVNSQMQAWVSSGGSEMVSHTLTRHQEILIDLTQEFHRLRSSLRAKQEHALLLDDFREFDLARLDLEDVGSAEQALLREHANISRSTGQMDSVISHAQATLGTLVLQRSTFGGINSKLSNVASRLPTINQVLGAIKKKKSLDTIILSLVASVCTFLIFIYWLTK